ncbi:glycosyltransferase family 39 protein [Pseudofrankia sp. DC12]|uniref:glycosyltransferase family 39 protein n=1 Tax=Pseudofrankia sp. DC12 TaxID=683315 RepID=UPI0005F80202|nr:glycosyltransferase family 39 protein [Pseudofrankia sp. DC12]
MTDVAVRPAERIPEPVDTPDRRPTRADRIFQAVMLVILAAAVLVRFSAGQDLWLDEAQSVAIAKLPLTGHGPTMFTGLREDGSPPLYYLFLHFWVGAFGTGNVAVRTLSALFNLAAAGPLYLLGRRLVGTRAAQVSVVLYITSPFALRFATETRMYSLIVLLTTLGGLAVERALRRPSVLSAVYVSLCAGGLALTHYWCLYLLLTVGGWLVLLWWRPPFLFRADRANAARAAAGGPGVDEATADAVADALELTGLPTDPNLLVAVGPPDAGARAARHSALAGAARDAAAGRRPRFPAGGRRGAFTALAGIVGGAIVFSPWLGEFRFQSKHTGTPWGEPASYAAISHAYGQWAGGPSTVGRILLLFVTCLVALGIAGRGLGGRFVLFDLKGSEPARTLFFLSTGTLFVAVTAGQVVGNAWADRYTATAFVPFLLVIGLGATVVRSERFFRVTVVICALAGVLGGFSDVRMQRTQASEAAAHLRLDARPGDVLLVCPDQLGPGLARTIPAGLKAHLIPTWAPPDRVNWVDYAQRNKAADPIALAKRAVAEAGPNHQIFLADSGSYRTYETLCLSIQEELRSLRPKANLEMEQGEPAKVYENYQLVRYQP